MLRFWYKRYVNALKARRKWFWLILLPPFLYLAAAAIMPSRYVIDQQLWVADNAQFTDTGKPQSYIPVSEVVQMPDLMFTNRFSLALLRKYFEEGGNSIPVRQLQTVVAQSMSLIEGEKNEILLSYQGAERELGLALVAFYADRLVTKTRVMSDKSAGKSGGMRRLGTANIDAVSVIWDADRIFPAAVFLGISALFWLLAVFVLELTDPVFKSERQVARYLNSQVLGGVPDLTPILSSITGGG